jgi:tRNA pseudouridine55 synthase
MKKNGEPPPSGYIILDKPPGITSFDALYKIKRALGTGKVGHTGTLDKFASGVMLILTGRALKLSQYLTGCDKTYEAEILFGTETDTLDPEGKIIAEAEIPSRKAFEKAALTFTGAIMQAPPVYSAIHIDGKRAHELARAGEAVEMKKRPVMVYSLQLLDYSPEKSPVAKVLVECSAGTYIRSLARDIALACGSRAHLSALRRTRVGGFFIEESVKVENDIDVKKVWRPLDDALFVKGGIPAELKAKYLAGGSL